MTAEVIVDTAGAQMGGATRNLDELPGYLARIGREDVEIIGSRRRIGPEWLVRRELSRWVRSRRVALNNVRFFTPGKQQWTLLRNALHFLTEGELARLDPAQRASVRRDAVVVHLAARRPDVIVARCTAMAERFAVARAGAFAFSTGTCQSTRHHTARCSIQSHPSDRLNGQHRQPRPTFGVYRQKRLPSDIKSRTDA